MFRYLLSFRGRSGRLSYFFFWFLWVALIILGSMVATFFNLFSPTMSLYVSLGTVLTMIISSIAVSVRRLHDMNISGWAYPVAFFVPPIVLSIITMIYGGPSQGSIDIGFLAGLFVGPPTKEHESLFPTLDPMSIAALIVYAHTNIFSIMLSFWPGTVSKNRFSDMR